MTSPVFLGDEVSAAGYALAGARAWTPSPGGESAALAAARADAPLVLVSAAIAARIPERELRAACVELSPLTVVVPDLEGGSPLPDVASRLARDLGLEAPR